MVVLSLFFLIITTVKTARSPVVFWKGSPLALLFCDIEQEMKGQINGQVNKFEGIERAVGLTKVELKSRQEGRWMFKAT